MGLGALRIRVGDAFGFEQREVLAVGAAWVVDQMVLVSIQLSIRAVH